MRDKNCCDVVADDNVHMRRVYDEGFGNTASNEMDEHEHEHDEGRRREEAVISVAGRRVRVPNVRAAATTD